MQDVIDTKLEEVNQTREKLGPRKDTKKKKSRSEVDRVSSSLGTTLTRQRGCDVDLTYKNEFEGSLGKARAYTGSTPTLTKLGISDFDQSKQLRGLNLTIEKATEKLKVKLKNKNTAEI